MARSEFGAEAVVGLTRAAAQVGDWRRIPALLARHGLETLAVQRLARVRDQVPADIWEIIAQRAQERRAVSLAMTAELRRIMHELDSREIPTITLKGPALAWQAYRDFGARPFVDLDIMVPPKDVAAAGAVLATLGYQPEYHFTDAQDRWFRDVDGDYPYVHEATQLLVELHVRPMSRRFGGMPRDSVLWIRREFVPFAGQSIAVLSADDAFLLQALHGAKHRWERMEWVAAVSALLQQRDGDVAAVLCSAPRARRAVLLACTVASAWLETPLSDSTRAECIRDPVVARLAEQAWHHVVAEATDEGTVGTATKLAFNFRVQRGVTARMRFVYRWVFWPSPEDFEWLRLPDWLFFVYRAVRPLRLLGRYTVRRKGASDA
ncbi:MAG TPA: nucleotidyltransferase family protein [Gemmatimonadaceae bacterium]